MGLSMNDVSLREMAKLLDVPEKDLKQLVLALGMGVVQSEAERMQAVEAWDNGTTAEILHCKNRPEIKHFRQALLNLTSSS